MHFLKKSPLNDLSSNTGRGFTLIEIVVAMGIFSILLLIMLGIFSRSTFIQRRDIAEQKLQEDIRFALELLSREARTGYGNTFTTAIGDSSSVYFANQNSVCVNYRKTSETLERAEATTATFPADCTQASYGTYLPLLSKDVHVTALTFIAQPSDVDSDFQLSQGFITVNMEAQATGKTDVPIALQNTTASRQLIVLTATVAGVN